MELLRAVGATERHVRGAVLLEQGQPSPGAVLIDTDVAKVIATAPDGSQMLLALCGAGDIFGEVPAVTGEAPTASVVAATPVTVTRILAQRFRKLLAENTQLTVELFSCVADRWRVSETRQLHMGHPPRQRLLRFLHDLAHTHGEPQPDGSIVISGLLTQREMASAIGVSAVTFARALGQLRDDGFLEVRYRKIRLLPQRN